MSYRPFGISDIDIEGLPNTLKPFSRVNYATDEAAGLGFVLLKENRVFEILEVNGFDRAVDTETKILEEVASVLGDNPSSTGTIRLFNENVPCESCQSVIQQF